MDFSVLVDIFDKYGISGIVLIICSWCVVLGIKKLYNRTKDDVSGHINKIGDKLTESLVETSTTQSKLITDALTQQSQIITKSMIDQQDKLITALTTSISVSKEQENNIHINKLQTRMNMSQEIKNKLQDIMKSNNAHRALVFEFHNSNQNLSGSPFAKYSCTYETNKKGAKALSDRHQVKPYSTIVSFITDIYHSKDSRMAIYSDIEQIADKDETLYNIIKNNDDKIQSMIVDAMYDNDEKMIGIVLLEYYTELPNTIDYSELKIDIAQLTQMIDLVNNSVE